MSVLEFKKGYPIIVIKWAGSGSSGVSVMLNSHMDVVPADEKVGMMMCSSIVYYRLF